MNALWHFLALLGVHWIADFVLQTHWQASNKSKNLEALARHIGTYTAILAVATPVLFWKHANELWMLAFVMANGALHFATDYFTSRWTSALYAKGDWHNFFVVIGLDQLIHQITLAGTMAVLLADK